MLQETLNDFALTTVIVFRHDFGSRKILGWKTNALEKSILSTDQLLASEMAESMGFASQIAFSSLICVMSGLIFVST